MNLNQRKKDILKIVSINLIDNKISFNYSNNTINAEDYFKLTIYSKGEVEIITNRIIDSDLDDKTKRSLLYFTPSPDGDVNRELYKQTAFLLSAESGTFANNLNQTTVYEYMKFLTKTEGGKRTAESAMGTTQLNKRVFLSDDFRYPVLISFFDQMLFQICL